MVNFKSVQRVSLTIVLLAAICQPVLAGDMYRYTNAQGNVVMGYQVPAEFVAGGYDVLNEEGVVIRVVEPQLSDDERAAASIQQQAAEQKRIEEERLRKWDESLLLRYSTVADIEAAQTRSLRDLQIRLSILQSNKRSLRQQIENYQAQAADLERTGQTVDESLRFAIEGSQREMELSERAIVDRQTEIEKVDASYRLDIERFQTLLEIVELRRMPVKTR